MGNRIIRRTLFAILILSVVAAICGVGYMTASPKMKARFTEFYILGTGGKATNYPSNLKPGEQGKVIVGIVNREQKTMNYKVEVTVDGSGQTEIGPFLLNDGAKWEEEVSFTPIKTGRQKVEFLLYTCEGEDTIFKEGLHLWVQVTS